MAKEMERKYFVKDIPNNLTISKDVDIEQMHIYKDVKMSIRIRKIKHLYPEHKVEYIYTLKVKTGSDNYMLVNKDEYEYNLTKEEYQMLRDQRINKIIHKRRIDIPLGNNLVAEIDVFKDYLDGVLTMEVEFPNEEVANNFKVPSWFGKEIGYKYFSNRKLAGMTKEQIDELVSQEMKNNNHKLIDKLNSLDKTTIV